MVEDELVKLIFVDQMEVILRDLVSLQLVEVAVVHNKFMLVLKEALVVAVLRIKIMSLVLVAQEQLVKAVTVLQELLTQFTNKPLHLVVVVVELVQPQLIKMVAMD